MQAKFIIDVAVVVSCSSKFSGHVTVVSYPIFTELFVAMEKYISFSLGCMDFIDSFQFMSSSLDRLVENLAKEGPQKFTHMTDYFGTGHVTVVSYPIFTELFVAYVTIDGLFERLPVAATDFHRFAMLEFLDHKKIELLKEEDNGCITKIFANN
jgi:hypothetical protein